MTRLPVDPATRLSDIPSMKPEEIAFATMEARQAAEAVLNRYRRKGDNFIKLIISHLADDLAKRQPPVATPSNSHDYEGSIF